MEVLLFLHLFGAVLFLGNIITAAFWKVRADREGDPAVIHSAAKNVMIADYVFTLPGLILLIVTGSLMVHRAGVPMSEWNWLTFSLMLFALTGILWAAVLIPLQRSMIRHSARFLENGAVSNAYRRASFYWAVFGTIATFLPIVILYLMAAKSF